MKKEIKKGSLLFKVMVLTMILVFVAPVFSNAQAGKANFTGTWAFNAEKSTQPQGGGGRGFGGGDMVAKQEANLLTVESTRTGPDGQARTTSSKYTLDGKESVNTTGRGESKSTAKWSADGKSLTIDTKSSFNGNEMTSTAVWTLTDAKTLTVNTTMNTPNGEMTLKMVYDKK